MHGFVYPAPIIPQHVTYRPPFQIGGHAGEVVAGGLAVVAAEHDPLAFLKRGDA